MLRIASLLCLALVLCLAASARAQLFVDDEPPEFLPGLVAVYSSQNARAEKVDEDLLFNWAAQPVDARFEPGKPFTAHWTGFLQAKADGKFDIRAYGSRGMLTVRLGDAEIINVDLAAPGWTSSQPIELSYGKHPVEISFAASENAQLGLYWSGPGFALEPIAPRYWAHRTEAAPKQLFEQGATLSRGLRCAACHDFGAGDETSLAAPALTQLQDNLRPSWLVAHLEQRPPSVPELASRRMPYYALPSNSAAAISAALFAASRPASAVQDIASQLQLAAKRRGKKDPPLRTTADPKQGAVTFASVGCLACHQVGELGKPAAEMRVEFAHGVFSGGDISLIATKRPRDFFSRLLADPLAVNEQHRMPVFELSLIERLDLAAYLSELGSEASRNDSRASGDIAMGPGLIARYRCAACHQLPASLSQPIAKTRISGDSHWDGGCLMEPDAAISRPGFGLTAEQRRALRVYVSNVGSQAASRLSGPQVLAENNCLACHSRDTAQGISPHLPKVAETYPQTAARLAGLSPPAITGVGDKLIDEALRAAIARDSQSMRPWLDVRMPKFKLSADQRETLVGYFIDHDRIPEQASEPEELAGNELPSDQAAQLAAARLVTSEGFGCQSCHAIGGMESPEVDLKARGTNLAMPGKRIRESWFHRWVRDPSRIVPRMEMPAIQTAAKGVLEDNLNLQLAALWKTLNTPDFRPPRPNPVRIVRNHNLPALDEDVQVVTCVIETEPKNYLRPLVIGLPNRHNVLYDLEAGELAAWWIGDTARQHTRGKTWYWEAGSGFLGDGIDFLERIAVIDSDGRKWLPQAVGQFAVSLDSLQRLPNGVRWSGRLHLALDDQRREVRISQAAAPRDNGLSITTTVEAAEGDQLQVMTPHPARLLEQVAFFDVAPECHATISSQTSRLSVGRDASVWITPASGSREIEWLSDYSTELPPDIFPPPPPQVAIVNPAMNLDCVPGYEAVQLPLTGTEMPISFAWGPDGQFYCGSLKGRVLQLHDDDADGLHERYEVLSDDLPTPYGMVATPDGLDVLVKYALLRLTPPVVNGRKWDAQVLADGWGYTADYHDWAVGLEVDSQGNYYVALPCQQDDRSEAAAYLRGTALKLVPNHSSHEVARKYRLEQIAAGLRFPMGIARNVEGDLFMTDNQGNYNPFNELNHVRVGKRYGFINKLENKDGFSPPFESPAINLPHPWTRSVNGICFLQTARANRSGPLEAGDQERFGPFAGHLIGCEMNGRSLIRMSLQKVGDTYQGAAYAFSRAVSEGEPTFEGPIVCEMSPAGDLYVGNLQDSGWGGGNNTGSIVRLRPRGELPTGIAEVRASATGFEIDFTQPVDPGLAARPDSYQIRSYRRVSTPAYGGDDQDEKTEAVRVAEVSSNGRQVRLRFDQLREGCVYEINIAAIGAGGGPLFPNQAHYTMRSIPTE